MSIKVITFLNQKGGVGKTTLANILATGLAMMGMNVLAIDADGQGDLTKTFDLPELPSFYDFAMRPTTHLFGSRPLIHSVSRDIAIGGNLHCVVGNAETYGIASSAHTLDLAFALIQRIESVRDAYDYAIIDTQPSPTPLHESLLMMSDYVIIPAKTETLSVDNLYKAVRNVNEARARMQHAGRDKAHLLGIVPNEYDGRTWVHEALLRELVYGEERTEDTPADAQLFEGYGDLVFNPVPRRTAIQQAQSLYRVTLSDAPRLPTNEFLWNFIDEVIQRIEQHQEVVS